MTKFLQSNKVYVKSSNSVNKINYNYLFTLLFFLVYLLVLHLFHRDISTMVCIIKTSLITIVLSIIIDYCIISIKRHNFQKLSNQANTISIALIITMFSYNLNIMVSIIAIFISLIIKNTCVNINLSSTLYGILFIILYNYFYGNLLTPLSNLLNLHYIGTYKEIVLPYGTIMDYLLGTIYLSPILAILTFFYLFHKKSIKYNLVFSYLLTFSLLVLFYGLLKGMNIYYAFLEITTGNIIFLAIYCLGDYSSSPTIREGQILYGVILGIMTYIFRFIIPELAVVVSLIIGIMFINKYLEKISIKLKYQKNYFKKIMSVFLLFGIITFACLYCII